MTWIPIFSVASVDFEKDLDILKKIFRLFEKKTHFEGGYKFSSEAQFAMGWWFYEIYVKISFIRKLVGVEHLSNSKIRDESDILKIIQTSVKQQGSKARIKFYGKKPIMARYWSWLLK